jgi:trehalose 6-phosphate phosphatase
MQHLFSAEGEAALRAVLQCRPLLAFDFDGTLAPIVARPEDARLPQPVSMRLAVLATRLPLAIVTGRRIDDVRGRLGFEPAFIAGSHGAEDEHGAPMTPAMAVALERIRERIDNCRPALREAGVTIEDKGLSIALHFRLSRTRERALQVIAALLTPRDEGVRVFGGKMVVNVVPRHAPDKAHAVHAILARSGAACALFAGDDVNDEPVFVSAPANWLTIRIGRDDRHSRARYFLDSPAEVAMLLERMVALLSPRQQPVPKR